MCLPPPPSYQTGSTGNVCRSVTVAGDFAHISTMAIINPGFAKSAVELGPELGRGAFHVARLAIVNGRRCCAKVSPENARCAA